MKQLTNLGDLGQPGRDPDALALIDLRGGVRQLTHGEVDAIADGIAMRLRMRGLAQGAAVAILSGNRWEYIAAYFGIMRAGCIAVPVNIRFPAETIAYILDTAAVVFAFVDTAHEQLVHASIQTESFDDPSFGAPGPAFDTVTPAPGAVAQILFTSGSTGRPKAVPLSHAGQLWAVQAVRDRSVGGPARSIVVQPLFHMNGLFQSKTVFATHGSMVMLPAFDPRTYLQAIAGWGVTAVMAVPTMLARALKETDLVAALDFSAVRLVRVGSAPVTQALLDRIAAAFPNAVVANGYGTTEAGPNVFGPHPDGRPTPMLSVGAALPGADVELVPTGDDPDQGVLRMRNPAVMTGYLNMPAASAKVLQDGWYNSGDVFRRDASGFYYFVGRADDMFVCSGENIYPADVEKMLERHAAIHTACVVPLPDEERGQMPVAFVVPRPGASLTTAEVKQFALAHGPAYQHPRRVAFVADLPWAGTNKIDRNALLARAKTLEAEDGWST